MHPVKPSLVAATHGRGIILIDDISTLRTINPALLKANLTFFPPRPFYIDEQSNFGGTAASNQFVGENPTRSAQIRYFLPKRHTFGKMTAEIVDLQGKTVSKLEAGKLKGINTIEWSFNATAPKTAKGKSLSFAGAPAVTAGKYIVRINKGSEVFDQEIEVRYDTASSFTAQDRSQQQKLTRELFGFIQDLAYLVYKIDQWDTCLAAYQAAQSTQQKMLVKLNGELDALRDKLVVTTGDNYVGASEPRLREKLNDIYGTVSSYYGAPSVTQIENIASLKNDFEEAKKTFAKLESGGLSAFQKILDKDKPGTKPEIASFDDFLKL
jgi:hypothetical protein